MSDVQNWVEQSAYARTLGIQAESIGDAEAILKLPFREGNSNPGGALHGGVYASLSIIGAHATARTALGADIGPFHTVGIQINYLSAAINEGVTAHARLLKRGKELAFVEVTCTSDAGKDVAHASLMIRGRKGAGLLDGPNVKAPWPVTNPAIWARPSLRWCPLFTSAALLLNIWRAAKRAC